MRIIVAPPPNLDAIEAAFPVRPKGTFYAYGDCIYNPDGVAIGPSLLVHEAVHGDRQGAMVERWWARYLAEPDFRLAEEIPAHIEEWKKICELVKDRNKRATILMQIVSRLSGPLYGNLISYKDAMKIITA